MLIYENQWLKNYTTIKIGGKVRWLLAPENTEEIILAIWSCISRNLPFFILAGGSNTVFEDDNLLPRQAVIYLGLLKNFQAVSQDKILADPGATLQSLVDFAQENHLSGLTGLNRVPGTIGGATVGNAGAYGTEIGQVVSQVEYIDLKETVKFLYRYSHEIARELVFSDLQEDLDKRTISLKMVDNSVLAGRFSRLIHTLNNAECRFGYRDSWFKQKNNLLITRVELQLKPMTSQQIVLENKRYWEIAKHRDSVYPPGFPSPGSMFKNIRFSNLNVEIQDKIPKEWVVYGDKLPVGKLLESINAKGFQVGNMTTRSTHANILVNLGGGKFWQVKKLVQSLQAQVKEKFGIDIEPEIRLVPKDFSQFRH